MVVYPAVFEQNSKGGVVVSFPDLPGCLTEGETEIEAMNLAADALAGHLLVLVKCGDKAPNPSPLSSLNVPAGGRAALVPVRTKDYEAAPVRISVSIGSKLLAEIDECAKREGMTRSGFLAAGARRLLRHLQE